MAQSSWTQHTVIKKAMVGKTYSVYNGKLFVPVTPTKDDIGKTLIEVANGG